jgi:hypothetical protein
VSRLTVNTLAVTPEVHVNFELEMPQKPFEDFKVKPEPEAVAV